MRAPFFWHELRLYILALSTHTLFEIHSMHLQLEAGYLLMFSLSAKCLTENDVWQDNDSKLDMCLCSSSQHLADCGPDVYRQHHTLSLQDFKSQEPRAMHLQSIHHLPAEPEAGQLMTGQAAANADQVMIKARAGSIPANISPTQSPVKSDLVLAADQAVAEAGFCQLLSQKLSLQSSSERISCQSSDRSSKS